MEHSTEVGGYPESLALPAHTDEERTDTRCPESLKDFWQQAGGGGLDTWHPLPDWFAYSRQSSDELTEESPYSFLIDEHFATFGNEGEVHEYRRWLRRTFDSIRA